jgi:hypothetical protein
MSDLNKRIKEIFKTNMSSLSITNYIAKWKQNSFLYFKNDEEVAQIDFCFVSKKHCEFDAQFGVWIMGVVNGGCLKKMLNSIKSAILLTICQFNALVALLWNSLDFPVSPKAA